MSASAIEFVPASGMLTGRGRTIALLVVLLAFFMDVLDSTIVNVAIPSIQRDLGASFAAIQWIIAGYSLAFALLLITGGRLGDIFGYKKLLLVGTAGFTIASAFCGLANSTEMLVAARIVQGMMAAMMVPQVLATIQIMYTTTRERQGVSVFYGGLAGVAVVAGPIIGALLITADLWGLEWRTIFLVNLPVGIAAIVLGAIYLPDEKSPHPLRLDLAGVLIIVVAMLMLMYPLIQGRQLDWPLWTFASMAASLLVFALFALSQLQKDRRDGSPLVAPQLFRHRSFVAGIIIISCFFAIVYGFFLTLTLFLQVGLGFSILKAGLAGIPFSLGVCVAAGISGPVLVPRFGRSIICVGPAIMAAGLGFLIWTVRHFGGEVTPLELVPSLVIAGIGMGCVVAPIFPFILAGVPLQDAGSASGVVNAVGQIGGAVGVAVIGAIFFGLIAERAATGVASVRSELTQDLSAAGIPQSYQAGIMEAFETCFIDRANSKDLADTPESCREAEAVSASLAQAQPHIGAAIQDALEARGKEANQRTFTGALERTLGWEIAALLALFFVTFLLPRQPLSREELEATGAMVVA
jgi:EmrB/QacA subfamily drug resistance transporter